MIGRTNTSSGVAFDSSMAVVRVSAPAGSTVTLSRGSTIKTSAEISSGSDSFYYFIDSVVVYFFFMYTKGYVRLYI